MAKFALTVNGRRATVEADPDTPLLYVLRNDLGLHAAKFGCGLGQCGACTVLVGGRATRSCVIPVKAIAAQPVNARGARLAGATPSAAGRVHRRAGGAVRVLHRRHGDGRQGAARPPAPSDGGPGEIRAGRKSLPVRHARPHRTRRPARVEGASNGVDA